MTKPLIVITGASSGIGEATARAFSALGHPLLLLARRVDRLEAMGLPNTLCRKVDVTNLDSFRQALEDAEAEYGPADCLVNNAGVMFLSKIQEQDPKEWQQMLNVNVLGVLNGIQTVLSGMMARQAGTIINVSSIAGRKTFPQHAAYCATKFAVHGLTETIREEVSSHKIRVVTIAPGVVMTELLGHTTSDEIKTNYEAWRESMGEALQADDVAQSILFAYQMPLRATVREIVIAPTQQQA